MCWTQVVCDDEIEFMVSHCNNEIVKHETWVREKMDNADLNWSLARTIHVDFLGCHNLIVIINILYFDRGNSVLKKNNNFIK